jgi:hypothetical protein
MLLLLHFWREVQQVFNLHPLSLQLLLISHLHLHFRLQLYLCLYLDLFVHGLLQSLVVVVVVFLDDGLVHILF